MSLIIGLYSLIIFFLRREEKAPLWFGLFYLSLILWFISTGDYLSEYTNIGYIINERFNFFVPYALTITFLLYLRALFPQIFRRLFTRIIILLALVQCLIVFVTPPAVFSILINLFEYFFAFIAVLILYELIRAVIIKRDIIPILNLSGALILIICSLNYALNMHYSYIGESHFVLQFGVITLILFNAAVIAILNARARRRSEELSERLIEEKDALIASEEKFRLITEMSMDCIFILDPASRITYVSPSIRKILGEDPEFYINVDITSLIAPEDRPRAEEAFDTLLHGGEIQNMEITALAVDGSLIPMEISALPVLKDGNIISIQGAARDITERKRAEEERKVLERQVVQAQKMEAIGLLAGGIAHDFNNILASMIGFSEMTLDELTDTELRENVEGILTGCWRAKDLVRQILTFSMSGSVEKRPLEMDIIVREALKLMRAALPATIEIRQKIEPDRHMIMADATQIHQIIMNLCTNAGFAMGRQGGILSVEMKDVELGEKNTMNLEPGRYACLMISDTGHGIAPEHIEKIFDPFFTTRESGLGMGLSVVYGIVKGHNGAITVESKLDQGSTFTVYLPCIKGDGKSLTAEAVEIPHGSERILMADDEPQLLMIQKRLIESLGYQVDAYSEASKALEAFRDYPKRYDLILTDMTMPGMTGKEFAIESMRLRPDIPIILCTGYSDTITEEEARRIGIREFLTKPLARVEVAHALRRVLDKGAQQ